MKRRIDGTSWREKLTPEGIQYLEEYRREKEKAWEEERRSRKRNIFEELSKISSPASPQPERNEAWERFAGENSSARKQVEDAVQEAFGPTRPPAFAELWKEIYTLLEQVGPEGRKAFAFALCMPAHLIWGLFHDVRKKHFADSPLSNDEFFWALGTALRGLGKILCTGEIESPTKGRVNVELLDLIKVIQQHQRKRLKYAELVEVLAFAHFHVPDEAWLRLFVHRARKKSWIR